MSVLHSLIGRRRFLASTLVGTIGVFLSVTTAMAQASGDTSIRPSSFMRPIRRSRTLRQRIAATVAFAGISNGCITRRAARGDARNRALLADGLQITSSRRG